MTKWLLILAMSAWGADASEFHVMPRGAANGDGSAEHPWDLATALAHPASVNPGDTIWLHGGKYHGSFESVLQGTADAPIIVRQAPGERAILSIAFVERIGAGLFLRGEHARYQGFEVVCENPVRKTATKGSWPSDQQRGAVTMKGSHLEVVNLILHDLGSGAGFWSEGEGGEMHGCLIYNNGWIGPDRSHGHGIYAQNERGTKRITNCLIFRQFGGGIHIYGSGKSSLRGFHLDGVVSFDNGRPGQTRNLLVGGGSPVDDIMIENCMTRGSGLQIGYSEDPRNRKAIVRNNYFGGGIRLQYPGDYSITGNTVVAANSLLSIQLRKGQKPDGISMSGNHFFKTEKQWNSFSILAPEGNRSGDDLTVLEEAGFGEKSTFSAAAPTENRVFVRPNRHEPGRAHVIVYNWERSSAVEVDLGKILEKGQAFRIVHARDFFGPSVAEDDFDGDPVSLPMTPRKVPSPIGYEKEGTETTDLDFGAFVVLTDRP